MTFIRGVRGVAQRRFALPGGLDRIVFGGGCSVAGLTVAVTGASAGIGREAARILAANGATVIAIARREAELRLLENEIGCRTLICDLSDEDAVAGLGRELAAARVDVLINNAGRSIRREVLAATDRLHDYQRTVRLNYLAAVQLSLALLPGMVDRGRGQIINVCTWGLHANTFPRFSAYAGSKSALASFGRSLNAERPHPNVKCTNVYFPLVRTEMIAPTAEYDQAVALSVEEAASWLLRAVTHQPIGISPTLLRYTLPAIDLVSPRGADRLMAALT